MPRGALPMGGGGGGSAPEAWMSNLPPQIRDLLTRLGQGGGGGQPSPAPAPVTPPPQPNTGPTLLQQQLMRGGYTQANFPSGWPPHPGGHHNQVGASSQTGSVPQTQGYPVQQGNATQPQQSQQMFAGPFWR